MSEHEHSWTYGGLRYEHEQFPMAGGGARRRIYHDWYFCSGCLAQHYLNARAIGDSYTTPIEGALPK